VDEEDHLRFNNRNFNGNFINKYIYNKSCRCRNTDHWTTLGTDSQSVEVSIVIKVSRQWASEGLIQCLLLNVQQAVFQLYSGPEQTQQCIKQTI
jgi:hypothetical protein